MDHDDSIEVRKNEARSRYELIANGRIAGIADYRAQGDRIVFPHTEISPDLRGRGLGAVLVREALDDLRGSDKTVVPACWFVAEFIEQNPEYQALIAA
jgi:predicted GNAT family acetyltransferase